MATYTFRIVNVFAEQHPLSGNALCVFENAQGLTDQALQALALQFNLSETTFIFPSAKATARVRIFTPSFEMPFAGHPTLGSAQVIRELYKTADRLTIETMAGVIPLSADENKWTLQAGPLQYRPCDLAAPLLAQVLGLSAYDIAATPLWVNTGAEQLILPLKTVDAVMRCKPEPALLKQYATNHAGRALAYVWANENEQLIKSRFFFEKLGSITEDYGTGSACANLGGWYVANNNRLPLERTIIQGEHIGRPSVLQLSINQASEIFVGGRVIEIARGQLDI